MLKWGAFLSAQRRPARFARCQAFFDSRLALRPGGQPYHTPQRREARCLARRSGHTFQQAAIFNPVEDIRSVQFLPSGEDLFDDVGRTVAGGLQAGEGQQGCRLEVAVSVMGHAEGPSGFLGSIVPQQAASQEIPRSAVGVVDLDQFAHRVRALCGRGVLKSLDGDIEAPMSAPTDMNGRNRSHGDEQQRGDDPYPG